MSLGGRLKRPHGMVVAIDERAQRRTGKCSAPVFRWVSLFFFFFLFIRWAKTTVAL